MAFNSVLVLSNEHIFYIDQHVSDWWHKVKGRLCSPFSDATPIHIKEYGTYGVWCQHESIAGLVKVGGFEPPANLVSLVEQPQRGAQSEEMTELALCLALAEKHGFTLVKKTSLNPTRNCKIPKINNTNK